MDILQGVNVFEVPLKIVRILNSTFLPGKFKWTIVWWLGSCFATAGIAKLTGGSRPIVFVGPIAMTCFYFFILFVLYGIGKRKKG